MSKEDEAREKKKAAEGEESQLKCGVCVRAVD